MKIDHSQLILDTDVGTLQYKAFEPLFVNLKFKYIQLLKLLLENKGKPVSYRRIATKLCINGYHPHMSDSEIGSCLKDCKKKLIEILSQTGMKNEEARNYVLTVKGHGYKLQAS